MPEKLKIFAILILSSLIFASPVKGAINSCLATVTPLNIGVGYTRDLTFRIKNTSSSSIIYGKISAPSSSFTISDSPTDGWAKTLDSSTSMTFTGGNIAAGQIGELAVTVTGNSISDSVSWTVQVSDASDGSNLFSCSGDLGIAVMSASAGDTSVPDISNISVSDVTQSSVKISWTTNENSVSELDYGTSDSKDQLKIDRTMTTSRTIELSGLSANTTYYYQVRNTDAAGNVAEADGNTFVTSKSATTTTVTKTDTKFITPTPTPTPAPDRTEPSVVISTDLTVPYEKAPEISGVVTDARSSIAKIEFSTDGGRTWIEVYSGDITIKSLPLSVPFKFTPSLSEDGNYKLQVRTTDSSNNTGISKTQTLIVDRLPPMIGGNVVYIGSQVLHPGSHGSIVTLTNFDQKITLSSVGGATTIDLLLEKQVFSLVKDIDSSLWYGTMNFSSPGVYQLKSRAIDGAGKITHRNLNPIIAIPKGKIISQMSGEPISGAKITLLYQEPRSKSWVVWDAKSFGQSNPQITNSKGEYTVFVPSGLYYLTIQANGFSRLTSSVFSIKTPTPINSVFKLKRAKTFRLGPLSISIPDFSTSKVSINVIGPSLENLNYDNKLLNKEAPSFKLPLTDGKEFDVIKLRGKPSVITFISTWAPPAFEQLTVLNRLVKDDSVRVVAVSVQESSFQLRLFQKRGSYTIPIVIDQDGTLVEPYQLTSLPTHYFLDRYGIVKKVLSGVLSAEEIKESIASVK